MPLAPPDRASVRAHATHLLMAARCKWMILSGDPVGHLLSGPQLIKDPYPVYKRLRAVGPVVPTRLPGLVVTTTHAAASKALQELLVAPPPSPEGPEHLIWDSPLSPPELESDPPGHTRIRKLVAQAFTPKAIEGLRAVAEQIADELLDGLEGREEIDLVAELAAPLPIRMICHMLGIPVGPTDRFMAWGEALALSLEPTRPPAAQRRIDEAGAEMGAYFTDLLASMRAVRDADHTGVHGAAGASSGPRIPAQPGAGGQGGVLGRLLSARDGEDRLTEWELVATCILLLGAGFVTTVSLIASGTLTLLQHRDQLREIVESPTGLIPGAVEEMLRYDAPVQLIGRVAPSDTTLMGHPVREGSDVMVLLGAANRDPAVFADPDRFDIHRPNARAHLAFTTGVHHCVGAPLARLNAEVAFTQLLTRFPDLRQVGQARRRTTRVLRGLQTLPVALKG